MFLNIQDQKGVATVYKNKYVPVKEVFEHSHARCETYNVWLGERHVLTL